MDDYFLAAGTTQENQAMIGMFCLTRDAKLWLKQHCRDNPTSSPSWEGMKQAVKERYLPPAHQALRMNEFYALRQLGLTLEEYYSKFVSLRRYAPQMTMEQQIARFCQGLNRPLSTRLEAMRTTSIQDALIRAKPLATEVSPFPQTYNQFNNFRGRARRPLNQRAPQHGNVAAATLEQGLPNVRCYECNQWGHFWNRCPQRQNPGIIARASPQPPQANQGNNQRAGRNGGRGRGRGPGRGARTFAAVGEPTLNDDEEERATLFAAIDNPGARQQYAVIQTTANHQGEKFKLLIACGSTHSFISPKCLRKLGLNQYPVKRLVVELANGKEVLSQHSAKRVEFELSGNSTLAYFHTLPIGIYDGILGMDWLTENQANIHCAQKELFLPKPFKVLVQGTNGKPKAHLVKARNL
ncbi:hypothetical protein L7F22_034501 [Adiantum nelumboides]|nr:hypothetical protein [Adiantum nelumboides]